MTLNTGTTVLAAAVAIIAGSAFAPAAEAKTSPGQWRFEPARCPDLVEDRRDRRENRWDERYSFGPRDRREDRRDWRESRRDERVTVCPAHAWVWEGSRHSRSARYVPRPAPVAVYYDASARQYYRLGRRNTHLHFAF